MVGYGDDRGIVPLAMEEVSCSALCSCAHTLMLCLQMFARIQKNTDKNVKFTVLRLTPATITWRQSFQVEASMMEIYNEKVRDLFNPAGNPPGGLKVRDHPQTGTWETTCACS
jgi:hypothetical protein